MGNKNGWMDEWNDEWTSKLNSRGNRQLGGLVLWVDGRRIDRTNQVTSSHAHLRCSVAGIEWFVGVDVSEPLEYPHSPRPSQCTAQQDLKCRV